MSVPAASKGSLRGSLTNVHTSRSLRGGTEKRGNLRLIDFACPALALAGAASTPSAAATTTSRIRRKIAMMYANDLLRHVNPALAQAVERGGRTVPAGAYRQGLLGPAGRHDLSHEELEPFPVKR